ncbi:nucleoid-associated protein [Serpentinicella sp. ANB-PHB4]|uniref:nucleoid-associated protein n=1 Tax=Serpentinicella sp. ANB-PHB4 TaxID=3074076 RepID=UPI00285A0BDF|nr:nucleoid-associated protein [Serpentinicella sp. ANB-PHB4]MDR5658954.1 nucleoid-associated protein [Serpentinicella sp. ANB-PHB4]
MDGENPIRVKKAILHILDNSVQIPVISTKELEKNEEVFYYLEEHILKVLNNSKVKEGVFDNPDNKILSLCEKLRTNSESFIGISIELAEDLFEIMKKNANISPGDVIICIFEMDMAEYLAVLKFNYKPSYIHHVINTEEGVANNIIRQMTTLPNITQKVDESIIINFSDMSIKLLEKLYEIDDEKDFYLSTKFLNCSFDLSSHEKFKIISDVTKKLNKKYFDEDFKTPVKLNQTLATQLKENHEIQVSDVANEVFGDYQEIKEEYMEEVKSAGINEDQVKLTEHDSFSKKLITQKFKTDSGIEIKLPSDYYNNKDMIEFINNPDGTISIILKNINKLFNRS